ncbi:MAG: hypothetical protein OXI80_06570 [Caldilineaceae bacterium]|nr:hypothetical protein [Caldilineaceae bacterium]MDE0337314.1 hypothetical protein [Caldilineaceae bacterium]
MDPQDLNSVDEDLVAAYVDGDVTTEERQRVEAAMAASEQVAWEVNTLRQTVQLLQEVPSVPLPRSFTLTEDQVADVLQERRSLARVEAPPPSQVDTPVDTAWQQFLRFLNGGDLALRNAAALAAVLLLLVFVAEFQLQRTQLGPASGNTAQLSSTPSTAQETAADSSLSEQTDPGAGNSQATADEGSGQEDDDPVVGVMSTGGEEQSTAGSEQEPVAAAPVQPETNSPAAGSGQEQLTGSNDAGPSGQPWVTIFRYARILLVLAVIVLWLLSRTRASRGRA